MQLASVEGNRQWLDGGAMFGNCPRPVWETWCPPDERHRIELACRCLLIRESSGRHVLLEAGIGAFFEPKLRERYGVAESEHVLLRSLRERGVDASDIDVVVLSHLHFDHAGGLLEAWQPNRSPALAFRNASYVVGRTAWERAQNPHFRDRASFIAALQPLLQATDRIELVEGSSSSLLGDDYELVYSDGHTPGLMLARVDTREHGIVTFAGDLVPGVAWVHLPITMGYDRYPELLIEEKQRLLDTVRAESGWLFFTHDPSIAAATLVKDERNKYGVGEKLERLAWSWA